MTLELPYFDYTLTVTNSCIKLNKTQPFNYQSPINPVSFNPQKPWMTLSKWLNSFSTAHLYTVFL